MIESVSCQRYSSTASVTVLGTSAPACCTNLPLSTHPKPRKAAMKPLWGYLRKLLSSAPERERSQESWGHGEQLSCYGSKFGAYGLARGWAGHVQEDPFLKTLQTQCRYPLRYIPSWGWKSMHYPKESSATPGSILGPTAPLLSCLFFGMVCMPECTTRGSSAECRRDCSYGCTLYLKNKNIGGYLYPHTYLFLWAWSSHNPV